VAHLPPDPAGGCRRQLWPYPSLSCSSAALAALPCFVCINSKNIFQLDLFHPRWPSTLPVTPSLSQTASHSILLSAVERLPPSSQALHLTDAGVSPEQGLLQSSTAQKTALQLTGFLHSVQMFDGQCLGGTYTV